jgi:trans-aconitate 2-methyltransferase
MSKKQYLFGDNDTAAQRLKLLAGVYQESTRAFLINAAGSGHFVLALDLGCGPGLTTRFIELARANADERLSFLQHDVTVTPFPTRGANLIFARFLLTHLQDPATAVAKWTTQVEDGGLLLLEETESIHTAHPVFARYLGIVDGMLRAQSNQLYAGRLVADLNLQGELKPMMSELRPLTIRSRDAARMFVLNLRAWKESKFIWTNYSRASVVDLEQALTEIAAGESSSRNIEWEMRQRAWLKDL